MNILTRVKFGLLVIKNDLREWRVRRDLARSAKFLVRKITFKNFKISVPFWYKLKRVANYPVFELRNKEIRFKNIRTYFALKLK